MDVSFSAAPAPGSGETVLSRFCACASPEFVLPKGRCSVHAIDAVRLAPAGLSGVKVKLTMRLAS